MKRLAIIVLLLLAALCVSRPAEAAPSYSSWAGNAALNWAESHALGHPYVWAGTGPGYDCSGLVMVAFEHAGISLPHSTYEMLASPHLHRIPLEDVQRGDLVFYGSGHVEIATRWYHESFGAHDFGTLVGWIRWSGWWEPTMAFEVT